MPKNVTRLPVVTRKSIPAPDSDREIAEQLIQYSKKCQEQTENAIALASVLQSRLDIANALIAEMVAWIAEAEHELDNLASLQPFIRKAQTFLERRDHNRAVARMPRLTARKRSRDEMVKKLVQSNPTWSAKKIANALRGQGFDLPSNEGPYISKIRKSMGIARYKARPKNFR